MSLRTKTKLEKAQSIAKGHGGICLSRQYVNSGSHLSWQCSEGHNWTATYSNVSRGRWCPICSRKRAGLKRRFNLEDLKSLAAKKGGKCLAEKYKLSTVPIEWQCALGHKWLARTNSVRRGSWCSKCAGVERKGLDDLIELAKANGGECLSQSYQNSSTKLSWRCKAGHIFQSTPHTIRSGHWCSKCGLVEAAEKIKNESKATLEKVVQSKEGQIISEFKGVRRKITIRCAEGHVWHPTATSVMRGSWCPICSQGIREYHCRQIFETLFNHPFYKSRPKWLANERGNRMELDGFCESLSIAFEHHGEQHYKNIKHFYKSKNTLTKRRRDDKRRRQLCKENGVTLIEIPYRIPNDKLVEHIVSVAKKRGIESLIKFREIDFQSLKPPKRFSLKYNEIADYCNQRGGTLISSNYSGALSKIRVRCGEGHEWDVTPSSLINQKSWCEKCGIIRSAEKRIAYSHDDVNYAIYKKSGELISRYQKTNQKIQIRCSFGHTWQTTFGRIMRGHWCPRCAVNSSLLGLVNLQKSAEEKGGVCLSKKYMGSHKKHLWQCGMGHKWETTPACIRRGKWCPVCSGKQKHTIRDMQILAQSRGGRCVSKEYLGVTKPLIWECSKNHQWEARATGVIAGTWCPKCAGNKKLSIEVYQEIAKSRGGMCLSSSCQNNADRLEWQCAKGHRWRSAAGSVKHGRWCRICAYENMKKK